MPLKIVASRSNLSELKQFAQFFHQDFDVMFATTAEGKNTYFGTLSPKQKRILAVELQQLLDEFPGKDGRGLQNAWFRAGAQWWKGSGRNLKVEMTGWVNELRQ